MTGRYWPVREVAFVNPPPADVQPYRDFFGGEVLFNMPVTRVVFDMAYMAMPLRNRPTASAGETAWLIQSFSLGSGIGGMGEVAGPCGGARDPRAGPRGRAEVLVR